MSAEPPAGHRLAVERRRFGSAAEALLLQDYCEGSIVAPDRPALLLWLSPRALLAAPADTRLPDFEERARTCAASGWPVAVRRGGGRVCPVSSGTLQLSVRRPVSPGVTMDSAYDEMASLLEGLLARLGLPARRGLCASAFCPGRHDISVDGRKLAGMAQVWRSLNGRMTVITGASLICEDDCAELVDAANSFYSGLPGVPHARADAVDSLSRLLGRRVTAGYVAGLLEAAVRTGGSPR